MVSVPERLKGKSLETRVLLKEKWKVLANSIAVVIAKKTSE